MNYVDATVLRLADEASRAALFDQTSLEQILGAAYDAEAVALDGPYQPLFDELELGLWLPRRGTVDARWGSVTGSDRFEGQFQLAGVGPDANVRVDGLWRGSVVARTVPADAKVETVRLDWPDGGTIDAEIVAALGSLPADAAALEAQRRARLLAKIRAVLDQPNAFSDAIFDRWLRRVGAASVGDLLTRFRGQILTGGMQLTYSSPRDIPPSPRSLAVTSALFVRDVGFSLTELLGDSKWVLGQLRDAGVERPSDPSTPSRNPILVTWIFPETVFDDPGWPGGEAGANDAQRRALRRANAGRWLAREGIGLVATAPST